MENLEKNEKGSILLGATYWLMEAKEGEGEMRLFPEPEIWLHVYCRQITSMHKLSTKTASNSKPNLGIIKF